MLLSGVSYASGHVLTAAELAGIISAIQDTSIIAHKTADQSLASNITFQNDNTLFASVAANAKYRFELYALVRASNATNGGLKTQFTGPSGYDISDATFRSSGTNAGTPTNANGSVTGLSLAVNNALFEVNGLLVTGANAGTFQFQWAQSGSSANATIVAAGSFLRLQRVV